MTSTLLALPARRRWRTRALAALASLAVASPASASTTGGSLPWNAPLDILRDNITGPTATGLIILAIAGALVVWSMSDDHRGLVRFGKALAALAILALLLPFLAALGINAAGV